MNLLEETTITFSLPNWLLILGISIIFILQLTSLILGFKKAKIARDRLNESTRMHKEREAIVKNEVAKILKEKR